MLKQDELDRAELKINLYFIPRLKIQLKTKLSRVGYYSQINKTRGLETQTQNLTVCYYLQLETRK